MARHQSPDDDEDYQPGQPGMYELEFPAPQLSTADGRGPVLIHALEGFSDAGHAIRLAATHLRAALDTELVASFAIDELLDYRSRRPLMTFDDGKWESYDAPELSVYRLADAEFLIVANAANTGPVGAALAERAARFDATVTDRTDDYALIAVQGPRSAAILAPLTSVNLAEVKYYASYPAQVAGRGVLLARTGYTGEDGFEIFAAPHDAEYLWAELSKAGTGDGLIPAGLAARDTLRLEAGMPLYGNELGADLTPFDAGLGRVVKFDKPGGFVGRDALARRAGPARHVPRSLPVCRA